MRRFLCSVVAAVALLYASPIGRSSFDYLPPLSQGETPVPYTVLDSSTPSVLETLEFPDAAPSSPPPLENEAEKKCRVYKVFFESQVPGIVEHFAEKYLDEEGCIDLKDLIKFEDEIAEYRCGFDAIVRQEFFRYGEIDLDWCDARVPSREVKSEDRNPGFSVEVIYQLTLSFLPSRFGLDKSFEGPRVGEEEYAREVGFALSVGYSLLGDHYEGNPVTFFQEFRHSLELHKEFLGEMLQFQIITYLH